MTRRLSQLWIQPSPRLLLILILLATTVFTGMATGFSLFYRLAYILTIVTVISYVWVQFMLRKINVTVVGRPQQIRVGDEVRETITLTNKGILPRYGLEVSDLTNLPDHSGGVAVSVLGRNSVTWQLKVRPRARGLYHLGPLNIGSTDLFNLMHRKTTIGESENLIVYPRVIDLPNFDLPSAHLNGDSAARRKAHNVTPHASSVREYHAGDSISRIHWNSTARVGKLMSKEFDLGKATEIWLAVDLQKNVQAGEVGDSTDEYLATIAASLAKRYLGFDLPVGLVASGNDRYFLSSETGAGQLDRIMQYLALAKADGITPLEVVLSDYEPLWAHNTSLIVLTPSPRTEWVLGLSELMRKGVNVTVIRADQQSFGGLTGSELVDDEMASHGITSFHISMGDDIASELRHTPTVPNRSSTTKYKSGVGSIQ